MWLSTEEIVPSAARESDPKPINSYLSDPESPDLDVLKTVVVPVGSGVTVVDELISESE